MTSDANISQRQPPGGAVIGPATAGATRWRQVFGGNERELAAVRRWLSSLFSPCPARDDVLSVATELGSNAVHHTTSGNGGWFAVEVTRTPAAVRVAVADCGGPAEPHVIDDPDGERGRGLLLVLGLSRSTGFTGDQHGRTVWAEVAWALPGSTDHATLPDSDAIRADHAGLIGRFTGITAWFGRSTQSWWALAGSTRLVTAPTTQELAKALRQQPDHRCQERSAAGSNRGPQQARNALSQGKESM